MTTVEQTLEMGNRNFHVINTAYPPDKANWLLYKSAPDYTSWNTEQGFALYVHIPFCKTRCKFCEYVTLPAPPEAVIEQYIRALGRELMLCSDTFNLSGKILYGFDIGGGTPTILSEKQWELLFRYIRPITGSLHRVADYEQGIETNAEIACNQLSLLKTLRSHNFTRISMGIQTTNKGLLMDLNRGYQANLTYEKAMENFHQAGFKKINLDVMYGLPGQDLTSWEETLQFIITLEPDQVSVYETRYKDSRLNYQQQAVNLVELNRMYEHAYLHLTAAGYTAEYGSTAFTRNPIDSGLSSYLRKRTTDFIPYLGLGIGSQTMTCEYLSYNYGKNSLDLAGYMASVEKGVPVEYFYKLPLYEILAKYIAIAFYLGYINYAILDKRMGIDFLALYKPQLDYLLSHEFINLDKEKMTLTRSGYRVYHGIIALFYPANTLQFFNMSR